jgi:hypothetical protein
VLDERARVFEPGEARRVDRLGLGKPLEPRLTLELTQDG